MKKIKLFALALVALFSITATAQVSLTVPTKTLNLLGDTTEITKAGCHKDVSKLHAVSGDYLIVHAYGMFKSIDNQKWFAETGHSNQSGSWTAPEGSIFKGDAFYGGDKCAQSAKTKHSRAYFYRVKNCIAAQALIKSANNGRDIVLEAYELVDGAVSGSAVARAADQSKQMVILSISGLDKSKEYLIATYGDNSSDCGFIYEVAFQAAPAAPSLKSYTIAGVEATIEGTTITAELPFNTDKEQAIKDAVIVLGGSATESSYNADHTTLTVTDGTTNVEYTLNITVSTAASTECELLNLVVENQALTLVENAAALTVSARKSDITALTVEFEVSPAATASIVSGQTQDFTNPLVITVTAQDGTTKKEYTITATAASARVLYVVKGGEVSANDTKIKPALDAKYSLELTKDDAAISAETAALYDLVILTEKPSSGDASAQSVGLLVGEVPVLNFKGYMFSNKNNWQNLGASNPNPAVSAITIPEAQRTHDIFKGLTASAEWGIELLSETGENGIQPISKVEGDYIALANVGEAVGVLEYSSDKPAKMITIPISDNSYGFITDAGLKLIENAAAYLLGDEITGEGLQTAIENATVEQVSATKIIENGQLIIIRDGVRYNALGAIVK